ncbi:hypothetical protein JTE90_005268 [Oedothorax gibbosus]|uniref:Uncharacterized protein n=1 Tax=Oedothorax gibbosus TaxID=931172 RepID=A0AAV6U2W1_9ARAC|nr:hypothetical protein JTE90_005268 [Oedothorax gibbosus]
MVSWNRLLIQVLALLMVLTASSSSMGHGGKSIIYRRKGHTNMQGLVTTLLAAGAIAKLLQSDHQHGHDPKVVHHLVKHVFMPVHGGEYHGEY